MKSTIQKNSVLLKHPNSLLTAEISAEQGGRLVSLCYKNLEIIKPSTLKEYQQNFASAILFPFANRIKNGRFQFEGQAYQLPINDPKTGSAIHGLVYDKKFQRTNSAKNKHLASETLRYESEGEHEGFPFKFRVDLNYGLSENGIDIEVAIKNGDSQAFPFTLGWHPYFYTSDLKTSYLEFDSSAQIKLDSNLIGTGIKNKKVQKPFTFEIGKLDHAFQLNSGKWTFITPNYIMEMRSSAKDNYLQLFTPENENELAIEPMTGVSDSFNNKIGLKVLHPGASFKTTWQLRFN